MVQSAAGSVIVLGMLSYILWEPVEYQSFKCQNLSIVANYIHAFMTTCTHLLIAHSSRIKCHVTNLTISYTFWMWWNKQFASWACSWQIWANIWRYRVDVDQNLWVLTTYWMLWLFIPWRFRAVLNPKEGLAWYWQGVLPSGLQVYFSQWCYIFELPADINPSFL